jgi:hypothetical protein
MLSLPTLQKCVVALGPQTKVVELVNWVSCMECDPNTMSADEIKVSFDKFKAEFLYQSNH